MLCTVMNVQQGLFFNTVQCTAVAVILYGAQQYVYTIKRHRQLWKEREKERERESEREYSFDNLKNIDSYAYLHCHSDGLHLGVEF